MTRQIYQLLNLYCTILIVYHGVSPFDICCCFNISRCPPLWMLTQLLQQPDKITRRINWAFILSITGEFEHLEPSLHVPHSTIEDYPQYLHLIRSSNHGSKRKIPAVMMKEEILFFRILSRGRIWLSILARSEIGRWPLISLFITTHGASWGKIDLVNFIRYHSLR